MTGLCDIYLVIPCLSDPSPDNSSERTGALFDAANKHYTKIASIVLYEEYAGCITRCCYGDYDITFAGEVKRLGVTTIKTEWIPQTNNQYSAAQFCTLTIIFPDVEDDIVSMLNAVTRSEFSISTQKQKEISLKNWLKDKGLTQVAPIKSAVFSSTNLEQSERRCILAAEKPDPSSLFTSDYVIECAENNIAQYSSGEIYASDAVILEIPKPFKDKFEDRIFGELATIFIVELHAQKLAFLGYFERRLKMIGDNPDKTAPKQLTDLNTQVVRTMGLWKSNIYRYINARNFSDEVGSAFRVDQSFQELSSAKGMLEQLINIIKLSNTEKENEKIKQFLLFLSFLQAIPLMYSVSSYLFTQEIRRNDIVIGIVSLVITLCIFLFFKYKGSSIR